jgi:N-acetylmuramoyl-L-alanine amidase
VLLLLGAPPTVARAGTPRDAVRLRDITVTVERSRARITLLVDGRVATLVTEVRGGNAQIRARSLAADRAALTSARVRSGVRSVRAHIERGDVLVVDVDFARTTRALTVVRRTRDSIVVVATLGDVASAPTRGRDVTSRGSDASSHRSEAPSAPSSSSSSRTARGARAWALSTIVIDAGHGGKDPGALGLDGLVEKDVTLAVALELQRELGRRMPGVRVVLTRDDDRFVELYRRGQIANERDGRLFISIHCNSLPDSVRSANGFECYILRPEKSGDAARVAAEENAAIRFEADKGKYDEMSAESAIVASMAQSAFARYSEQAALAIRSAMRAGTPMNDRGVHQAGFFVLIGASMPAVLVEIGYLSSARDSKSLKDSAGRRKIARALARGIVAYERQYSRSLR